ncbi:MAG: hydroxyphenylacetyl-CoA thioesterase PaaI [Alphaproteobacteria bacterium]|nr:hydroxyphenylacetyl-CoA thioesterase PaaI [Alphaproteobacteria bacterium]
MEPDALARAAADVMWAEDKASRGMGMRLIAVAAGRADVEFTVGEGMTNGHGQCHGGFIFALADSAFGFACNSHNHRAVAQHCAITYIAPARLGDILRAEAIEQSRHGRSAVTDVRVTRGDGTLIALFRGHSRRIAGDLVPGLGPPATA